MKNPIYILTFLFAAIVQAQEKSIVQQQEIIRIETELASD
jgi:hypothetical protein